MAKTQSSTKPFKSPAIHRTPVYRAYAAYYGMLARCENKDGKNPSYADVELRMTFEEWLDWSVPKYEAFILINPSQSPSVSRFGDKGHYEIGNLEIISFIENRKRQRSKFSIVDGKKSCGRCGQTLAIEAFYKNKTNANGVSSWCKKCSKSHCTDWRIKKRIASSIGRAIGP